MESNFPEFEILHVMVKAFKKQKRINLPKWENLIINMKNYNAFVLTISFIENIK